MRSFVTLGLLVSLTAAAEPFTPDRRLLLSEGVLRGSPRLLGIAGAFVGVAETAEGITRNPAAAASKDPRFERELNFDFGAAMHFLPPWAVSEQDWDNDGRPDQAEGGPLEALGTQVIYLAGSVQYKNVGFGIGADLQNFVARTPQGGFNLGLLHTFASVAGSFWEDQILIGLGLETTHSIFGYFENRALSDRLGYHGYGVQFGGLWRPKDEDYRVGFAFRPQVVGKPDTQRERIGGLQPFSAVIAPARVSVGGSWALGSTGRHYNITGKDGWGPTDPEPDGTPRFTPAMTKWLITTQLDVFMPVGGATNVTAFLEQGAGVDAQVAGNQVAFQPRVAVEKEILEERLRLRLGGYLEPALVPSGSLRPHLTYGGEVYLFQLGTQRISFGLSFDLAQQYQNLSVAFLVWK